ncbi:MAG: DNA repair exonuclease, partial [Eubacteriales bacterium]|nr:DNA repair exonuclease [Eubacteriales bacterium]
MTVKILHTADLHLGSRMRSLGQDSPDFQEALIQSFDSLLQKAAGEDIDLFLIAGDFLEMAEIEDRELKRVYDLLARERSYPILLVAGNHDPYSSASPYATVFPQIPQLYVFPADRMLRLDFRELDTSVWGISFSSLYQTTTILPEVGAEEAVLLYDGRDSVEDEQATAAPLANKIGLVHGEFLAGSAPAGAYNPLPSQLIKQSDLDYLALGHIHKASELPQGDYIDRRSTLAMYPGSPQGLSFNEAGNRHALIVELENSEVLTISQLNSASRMFVELSTELESSQSDQQIIDQIVSEVKEFDPDNYQRHSYK